MPRTLTVRLPTARTRRPRIVLTAKEVHSIRVGRRPVAGFQPAPSWYGLGVSAGFYAALAVAYTLWPQLPSRAVNEGVFEVAIMTQPVPPEDTPPVEQRGEPASLETMAAAMLQPAPPPIDNALPPEYVPPADALPAATTLLTSATPDAAAESFATPAPPDAELAVAVVPTRDASAAEATGAESNYWDAVRTAIASHLRYPPSARRRGVEGFVSIRVTVDANGHLLDAQPVESSDRVFVEIALDAASRAAPFPPATNALAAAVSAVLPIRFQLRPGAEDRFP